MVLSRLGLGVTAWPAQGMFTAEEHTVLFCTVSRPDVNLLKVVVIRVDPDAFLVVGHGHQATGGVFRRTLRREPQSLKLPGAPDSGKEHAVEVKRPTGLSA